MKGKRATHMGLTNSGRLRLLWETPKFWAEKNCKWHKSDGRRYPVLSYRGEPEEALVLGTVRPRTSKEIRTEIAVEITRAEQHCNALYIEIEAAQAKYRYACDALDSLKDEFRLRWVPDEEVDS